VSQELWNRWESFLGKIAERQKEIFTEAEAGIDEIIAAYPEDVMPLGNALSGLRFRVDELRTKINDTWDNQVEPKFSDVGGEFLDRGFDRKEDFLQELSAAWDLFEARMRSKFYRALEPRAKERAHKPVPCVGCGGELTPPNRYESHSVKCPSCNAVNQVMADTAVALYEGRGHAFGEEAALPLRHEIERFRISVNRWRRARDWAPEPIESMDQWAEMERRYWETYADVAGRAVGRPPDREFVESRVNAFLDAEHRRDQRWRKAKGV
jgi:hypothetical protein